MTDKLIGGATLDVDSNAHIDENDEVQVTEEQHRANLFAKAEILGIKAAKNTTTTKLEAMILAKLNEPAITPVSKTAELAASLPAEGISPREALRRKAMKLRRVIIQANDPNKAQHEFEQITVGNLHVGSFTRVYPLNVEWHIEQMVYDTLKERMFQMFQPKNKGKLLGVPESKLVPAYTIIDLPPLTEEELKTLAASQAARHAID